MKKYFAFALILIIVSCSPDNSKKPLTFGFGVDITTLNPMYSFSEIESNINELLFLSLVYHKWDSEKGEMSSEKILAKKITWNSDSSEVLIEIRDDCKWSDGKPLTTDDIVFSYDLCNDPELESSMFGYYTNFNLTKSGKLDIQKTFEIISKYVLKIKFRAGTHPNDLDLDIFILPKHVIEKIPKSELNRAKFNHAPVTSGAYKVKEWKRNQYLLLEKNKDSFLVNDKTIPLIMFKVIPDYNNRILQLKNGELDFLDYIESENVSEIKNDGKFNTESLEGRFYDYIGFLNNKDGKPHPLFGDVKVRKAIAYSLDRETVIEKFLFSTGDLASGPLTELFKSIIAKQLPAIPYNPDSARILLTSAGFKDKDNDGILEKDGYKFKFTLFLSSGNPKRIYAAQIFKENLKQVGIDMNVEVLEINTFMNKLFEKKLDAWMLGYGNSIPPNFKLTWYSDPQQAPMNFFNYKNYKVDSLVTTFENLTSSKKRNKILNQINSIIYKEQPCVFLYYLNNIVAINKRVKNYTVNSLNLFDRVWEWEIKE